MSAEGRLTKANPIVGGRSGVDLETMPEKNYEVLVDIYELLEKWFIFTIDGFRCIEG